jgi:PAS domain S-box-containing protein
MSNQRNSKRSFGESNSVANSLKESNSTPYKRRKQTGQALEALSQLFKDSLIDDSDNNKFNKNDILSLTLSRLLRSKYWPSDVVNRNVQLAAGIQSSSICDDLTGFIIVLNTAGRIILLSDNVEYYLRKNVRSLYPQLTSIYECVSKDDHDTIRQILSTPTLNERRAICNWILPRGKRPNRSHAETKSMLLTGHYFFLENEFNQEPLFVARCEQILSSIPNVPTNSIGSTSTTTLRFVLTDQLNITEVSPNIESVLGYSTNDLTDESIQRILPTECMAILEQAKQNCLSGEHCTSMNVLDLFTQNGDRLTFLCNTHMLVEGRRKTMKLGFLAQLIDPSVRY